MKNLTDLTLLESCEINGGGLKLPIGLGGIIFFLDAAKAYMDGIEAAYYEKNPPTDGE